MIEKEFHINNFITLKLEGDKTNIYVGGKLFCQCKFLLINIPVYEIGSIEKLESIDEAAEKLSHFLELRRETKQSVYIIPPDVMFWGHCSNLQVWNENNYNTKLLEKNLAFPLLKKLTELGDPLAKRVFKESIAERLITGHSTVIEYLLENNYIKFLEKENIWTIIMTILDKKEGENAISDTSQNLLLKLLKILVEKKDDNAKRILKEEIIKIVKLRSEYQIKFLYDNEYIKHLNREEFWKEFGKDGKSLCNIEKAIKQFKVINGKRIQKRRENYDYFCLYDEITIENKPLAFTFKNNSITGIGIWSSEKNLYILENLPDSLFRTKNLKKLVIHGTQLKEIPNSIGNMKNLKILSLTNNSINEIPKTIYQLSSLEYLGLNANRIREIPKTIAKLKNLKRLELRDTIIDKKKFLENFKRKRKIEIFF